MVSFSLTFFVLNLHSKEEWEFLKLFDDGVVSKKMLRVSLFNKEGQEETRETQQKGND